MLSIGPDGKLMPDEYTEYAGNSIIENQPNELGRHRSFFRRLGPFRHIRMMKKLLGHKKHRGGGGGGGGDDTAPDMTAPTTASMIPGAPAAEVPSAPTPVSEPVPNLPAIEDRPEEGPTDVESAPQYPPQPSIEERESLPQTTFEQRDEEGTPIPDVMDRAGGIPENETEYASAEVPAAESSVETSEESPRRKKRKMTEREVEADLTAEAPEQENPFGEGAPRAGAQRMSASEFSGIGGYIVSGPTPDQKTDVSPDTWVSTLQKKSKIFGPSGEVFLVPAPRRVKAPAARRVRRGPF